MTMQFEEALQKAVYIVEANSFEILCLWKEHKDNWVQIMSGNAVTVGYYNKRPICVSQNCEIIFGQPVLFIDPISQLVDHKLIDAYYKEQYPHLFPKEGRHLRTNAMNFGNCLHHIRRLNNA